MRRTWFAFSLIVAIYMGASALNLALASHGPITHIYFADDQAKQINGPPGSGNEGVENWVQISWGLMGSGTPMWWWADSGLNFRADVITAIGKWTAQIPQLTWAELPPEYDPPTYARIMFRGTGLDAQCAFNAHGCFAVTSWYYYATQNASYWWNGKISIDPDYPDAVWGVGPPPLNERARAAALAHKIGHAYGLHERYSAGCNDTEATIMDSVNQIGGLWFPCDAYGPTSIDVNRVQTYWHLGENSPHTLTPNYPSTGQGTWQWEDGFWAESFHYAEYWYHTWNYETGTWNPWVRFDYEYINTNIGTHRTTETVSGLQPRVFTRVKDRFAYEPDLPAGQYVACFYQFNWQWGTSSLGTQYCSNYGWLY